MQKFVPVFDVDGKTPLMPTIPSRADKWVKSGKATPFWKRGIWCVRLNNAPSSRILQTVVVGVDPGSKREGYSIKSEAHTYLNIQATAVGWVKDAVEVRRNMRRTRRTRKTPYRKMRSNRNVNKVRLPPSTKARWQWKLRLCKWLTELFPVTVFVIEDIKATTKKGAKRWNNSFSPLEVGKHWMYIELAKMGRVVTKQGFETFEIRQELGLKKNKNKLSETFNTHCVDSWVLANWWIGGHTYPDNTEMLIIEPIQLHRRQLHAMQPAKGNIRRLYGSTRSMGFKRGGLVKHKKWGVAYVGGTSKERISLHCPKTGKRLCQTAKVEDTQHLTFNYWRCRVSSPA